MGVLTWKQASADYEKKSAGSNTAGTTPPTSGMLSWKQAADEFDRYDEDGYKALGMQRMAQMQEIYQAQKDRVSGMERLHADDTVNDWLNRYNRVMQGITRSEQKRNGGFTHDADSVYGAEIDALLSGYDGIKNHSEIRQYYDSLTELKNSLSAINESMAQFEDENAFDQYMAYWKDQEEKRNLDLDAYSRDISALEQQLEDYDPQIDWTDTNQRKQYDKGLQELEDEINRRKQYLAQAQRIQKKDDFSAVANPDSDKYDAAFGSKSGYVSTEQDGKLKRAFSQYSMGYGDLTYEYINNQNGIRDEIKHKASAYSKGETPFEEKGYDYMTEDEVGLYNYYYSMGGKKSAEAYLETIQDDLNQRKAAGMYQQMEGKTGAELVFGVEAGLDQFKSGIKGAVRAVKGDDSYVAPSATQYASGMVREDLADDGFKLPSWLGGASLGQVGYDAITTSANMAPSIAVGMLNPTVGAATMGVSAGGSAYQEALNDGYSVDQARGYGILSGASEIVMEKVLGGISAYGGNTLGKFFTQNMKNADTALKRIAKELGGSMLSEFSEEYLQEVLTPVFQNLTLGTDNEVKLVSAEALYAGFLGAITGGIMEGPSAIASSRNATQLANNPTPELSNATETAGKSTPLPGNATADNAEAITEESSAAVAENATTTGEPVTLESLSEKYGDRAADMRKTFMEGQDVQEYDRAFRMAYDMGKAGVNESYAQRSEATAYLSETQRSIAYNMGALDAQSDAGALAAKNAAAANGKTGWRKGTVKGQGVKIADMSKAFNDPQRKAYKYLTNIAEVTGVDIVLYKSEADADGRYQDKEGSFKWSEDTIYIDINAGLESYKDAESMAKYTMMRVFDHEFTHFVEKWNPQEYTEFRKTVFETMTAGGTNVEDLIDAVVAKSGGKLNYDQASREVIAEAMTDILPDSHFIEQLAQKNQNVFQQLLSKLKEFLTSIREHFASMGDSTKEAKALKKQMGETVSYMEEIVKKFDEVAVKAVENYQRTVAEDVAVSKEETTTETKSVESVTKEAVTGTEDTVSGTEDTVTETEESVTVSEESVIEPAEVASEVANVASEDASPAPAVEEYRSEHGYTIRPNEQYGSLEITFDSKPSQSVRDALKANKFRWNGKKGVWYGKTDQQTIADALDKAYEKSAAPAPVDLSQKPMERTGDTVTIGDPAKATHEVEITLSDEEYDALMQAVPESKPQDAYTDLETALATANVSVKNGYRFDVRFTPGANIYTGSIERAEDPNGYPVFNARSRIYTTGSLSSRPEVVKELTDVARNNKLLDPREAKKPAKKATETGTSDHTPSEVMAAQIVSEYLTDENIRNTRKPLTAAALYEMADKAFGGTQAEGAYNRKDAYDALELAVNKHLLTAAANFNGNRNAAVYAVAYMQRLLELLPTQSVRTQEQQDFQQFSTPPNIAYLAAWAANITAKDSVLEPSAGIGGLAVFAKAWGAEVSVNELSKRRLEVLRAMGFDHLFNENAEQIDNILPENISPSVVIMNPPFSSTAGRTSTNKTSNAEKHIDQALARLRDGGRLVAILGKGMNNADYSRYWNKLRKEYNIRANLSIDGSNYKKYGTTWGVQIVVIDKTGPQTGETITGSFTDLREVPKVLEGIRNDRSTNIEPASPVESSKSAPESAGAAEGQNPVSDAAGVVDQRPAGNRRSGKRAEPGRTGNTAHTDVTEQPGRVRAGDRTGERDGSGSAVQPGRTGKTAQKSRAASDAEQRNGSIPAVDQLAGNAGAESAAERSGHESQPARRAEVEPSDDGVYATFVVPKLPVEGGKPHPAVLVESAAMAAVSMPEATYKPKLPADVVKNNLSEAQMVTVTYAGQAHEQNLPDGRRKGFFIGDGTGVGKGRQIAGIILDNFMQGRTKAVWISKNNDLYGDAIRDWTATTGRSKEEVLNHSKIKPKDKISLSEGILYSTYDTLKSEKGGNRLDQIVAWVGEDFDGVIAFDEAHNMGNLFGKKGKFGKSKGSEKAKAGVELQRRLPKARIVYVSATAATEVDNLAYAERIGLWGSGTAFADAKDFISKIGSSGLAAMELVIRDMKAMGVYVARSISYNGVNYDTVEHPLDPMQMEIYDTMSKAWQKTMANVQTALVSTGGNNNSTARQRAMGNFYSSMQRFYNQVLTSMSMPSVIADMRRELDAGRSCVLQIVNTNEAQQNKQLAEAKAEGRSLDDLDLTPREALIGYLMNSFPTQMFEEYTDEDGNLRSRPVVDSNGAPVHNKKAIQQRDALIAEVNQMSIPDGPLEMLFDAFGTEAVAENTGRSRRVVPKKMADGSISRVEESRTLNHRTADVQAFQDGKKRILIFSDAGGTGKSYHAALNEKNQQQRVHYVLQPGWVASNAVQGFGRTHRSNEASAPVYKLVTTNIKGQKRFTSTIARRLDQLGALTKGQRDTGSGMFGTKDNLETDLARDSLREFYIRLGKNQIEGIDGMKTLDRLGLKQKFTDEFGGFKVNDSLARDIGTFLNRILALEVEEQNTVFDAFISIYEMELEAAMQAGTLDTGMENVKADKIEIVDDKVIREGSSSGASTHYIQAKTYTKPKVVATVAEMATRRTGFVGVYKLENDSIRAVYRIADKTTEWGAIQKQYRLVGPNLGAKNSVWNENTLKAKATEVARKDWQKEWDAEVARVPEYNESTLHMLTGALLPVWNTLPQEGNTKVKRLIANDGSVYLGRVIDSDMIDSVLGRFSVGRTKETYTAQQVMDKALKDGTKFQLSNNRAEIFRSKVSGEWRLEISQQNAWYLSRTYPGLIQERIQYRDRYFIPVGDKGIEILNRILEYNPVRNTSADDVEQFRQRTNTLTDREVLAIAANDLSIEDLSEAERGALDIFRDRLAKLDNLQEQRLELGRLYREQQFGPNTDRQAAAETLDKMHAMDARIRDANDKVLDVEEKSVLRGVLQKARKVVEQQQKAHDDEILKRWRDRRNNAAAMKKYRQRIAKDVKAMSDWVLNPNNKDVVKHVPDVLKNSVIPFITSIDFTSKQQLRGGAATKADADFVARLEKLRNALKTNIDETGLYSGYNDLPPNFMDKLNGFISAVQKITKNEGGDFVINQMTSEELKALSEIVSSLKKLVQDCNRFHYNSMYQHVYEAGDDTIGALHQYKDAKSRGKTGETVDNFVFWQQIRPAYAWERFGNGGKAIYDGLRRGQAQLAFNTQKIVDFSDKTYTEEEVLDWEKEVKIIELDDGSTIRVKTAQAMSFYELSKDKDSLRHILGQGIRVATYHAGREKVSDTGHLMSIEDVGKIIDSLTPRQKDVADSLQKFMADQGAKWGNYVSVKRFGEELFGNPTYFPINSDGRHLQATTDEMPESASLYALLNMGFTKARNEKANNRIVLYSIFDVFANHMASMAQYNALSLPVLDALKWFNYQQKEDVTVTENGEETVKHTVKDSVRDELNRVYGVAEETRPGSGRRGYAENFITGILKAFNGTEAQGIPTDESGLKLRHRYNMAQVAFNLRVVAQQPLAITRAGMLIPYKSILRGMRLQPAAIRKNIAEMQKYSGIAAWKGLGFYDINISRGLTDIIKHSETWRDKINELGMWGAEQADRLTWAGIWSACKEEVIRRGTKPGDKGYFEAVSELFEDVIYKTQVVDSVLTKNEYMRSKGFWARTTSSFMSEPVTNASMLIDAYDKLQMDMQKGMDFSQAWRQNKGTIGRTAYVYGMGAAVLAAVTAVMDALRDDDEYETFLEKWSEAFSGNLIDELNPLGKLPLVKEVSEFVKELAAAGWKVDVYGQMSNLPYIDMAEQFIKGVEILSDKINAVDTNYTWYGGIYKLLQGISGISGLPMAATTREIITIWNNTVGRMAPSYKVKTYDAGEKSTIKYAYQDGYLTEEEAMQELLDKGLSDNEDEAYWLIRKWDSGTDSFSRYDAIDEAVRSGNSINTEMGELTSHGYTEEDVRSHIKTSIGKWYQEGTITKQQAMDMLKKYSSLNRNEITEIVNRWSSKVVTGIAFDDIKERFMSGDLTQSKAAEMYVRYGGYTKEKAAETVSVWAFVKKHPECDGITSHAVADYTTYCEKAGVPAKTFYQAWKHKNTLTGTVKAPMMEYINGLNLSRSQKDSLYYAFGWAESTINEAPWH